MLNANLDWGRIALIAILLVLPSCGLFAQVLQFAGGTSTLYQSQGGSMTLYGPSYNVKIGIGYVNGQVGAGATLIKNTKDATYTAGDAYVALSLPTDVFSGARYLLMTGAGIRTTRFNTDVVAFGGMSATNMGSTLFDGIRAQEPAALLAVNRKIDRDWSSTTDVLITRRESLLQSIQWAPSTDTHIAASGGIGSNQPYAAVSAAFRRRWIDAKASYIKAGGEFHVIGIESQYTAEPTHENVLVTIHPFKYLSLSGGRQNYIIPAYKSNLASTSLLNQVSGALTADKINMSAGAFQTEYGGKVNTSTVFMASRTISSLRTSVQGSYIESKSSIQKTKMFLLTTKEVLSPRWTVNQTLYVSNGNTTVNFGGSFLSNLLTGSVDYQTFYIPENIAAPFKQSIVVNIQGTLFGRLRLQGTTYVDAQGKLRYTTAASLIASRAGASQSATRISIGKYAIRGRVVDRQGKGIENAALQADRLPIFTDSSGAFLVRERKSRTHRLTILGDQFIDLHHYAVVSAPATITSSAVEDDPGVTITVEPIVP